MVGRKITIIASPLLKEWKLKKLIGRNGVIIKENQNQKTKGVWIRLNEPFANELAYIIHSGFISGYQNRYGDNLKPPTNVYHRMTA